MLLIMLAQINEMKAHGVEGFPHEVCGLMLGTKSPSGDKHVSQIRRCGNLNTTRAHDRFELDPKDYTRIEEEAKTLGLEILGVYHTHPNNPCRPSETDRLAAEAWWSDSESWSYAILEISKGKPGAWKSWVLKKARFHEETWKAVDQFPT